VGSDVLGTCELRNNINFTLHTDRGISSWSFILIWLWQLGYIAVNSLTSQATGTNVPILAQGMTGLQGTHIALPQLVSGHLQTSDLTTQTPVVHLAPMGYAPGTAVDGTQILQLECNIAYPCNGWGVWMWCFRELGYSASIDCSQAYKSASLGG